MNYVLITGMARSGTTLLDKYLGNHPAGKAASQPIPLLFIELKKIFYREIGHPGNYYVLNHLFGETRYTPEDLAGFLRSFRIPAEVLECVFTNADSYSGQHRVYDDPAGWASVLSGQTLSGVLEGLLRRFFPKRHDFLALKEIYVEEFIPYFLTEGWKVRVILRDPRDVIASMNTTGGQEYTGPVKPTLFHIRNWRKSVRFYECPGVVGVHFELLLRHPEKELNRITADLSGREAPESHWFQNDLPDEFGKPWRANSSFSTLSIGNRYTPRFMEQLTEDQIAYIEAYAYDEMQRHGYRPQVVMERPGSLEQLPKKEPFNVKDERLGKLYSDLEAERIREWAYRSG